MTIDRVERHTFNAICYQYLEECRDVIWLIEHQYREDAIVAKRANRDRLLGQIMDLGKSLHSTDDG